MQILEVYWLVGLAKPVSSKFTKRPYLKHRNKKTKREQQKKTPERDLRPLHAHRVKGTHAHTPHKHRHTHTHKT